MFKLKIFWKFLRLITVFVFLLLNFQTLRAQGLEWVKKFSGLNYENGYSIAIDDSNNVYSIGTFLGTTDFDPGTATYTFTSPSFYSTFVVKMNSSGDLVWAKKVGGTSLTRGISIKLNSNGDIILVGYFSGTTDFDPSATVFNLNANAGDVFVCKLTNSGDLIWAKRMGGTGSDDARGAVLDNDDNIYITGQFESTVDFDPDGGTFNLTSAGSSDVFVTKLNTNGNFIWAKKVGGTGNEGSVDIALKNNALCFTGIFSNTVDFDPGTSFYNIVSQGFYDVFICELDLNGNFKWTKSFGSGNDEQSTSIVLDAEGNVYTTGTFKDTIDLDPGINVNNLFPVAFNQNCTFISKLDSSGNFIWAKQISATFTSSNSSICLDLDNHVYISGDFSGVVDLDPGPSEYNGYFSGNSDIFITCLNDAGVFLWGKFMTGSGIDHGDNSICLNNNLYTIGSFGNTLNFDSPLSPVYLSSAGNSDVFISKNKTRGVYGFIYNDLNNNCNIDTLEFGLEGRLAVITPGNIIVETNSHGIWYLDSLPIGNYNITFDTTGPWNATCPITLGFVVTDPKTLTVAPNFGLKSTQPCTQPDVSITAPFLRRCFSNQMVYVQACNQNIATGALNSAYIDVELDSLLTPTSSSLPYTNIANNQYRFNVGNINPGQCINFTINTTVSCAANLQQTLCMEASLFPADSCVFDTVPTPTLPDGPGTVVPCTLPWDRSSLSVDGWCANDTVYFTITNTGSAVNGNMQCYAPVRVYVDGVLTYVDSVLLSGGQTITYSYPGNGQTWILQADQHPLHPGNSHPNAHVEACGNIANWTPGLVNNLPLDDADPVVDIYCGVVSGAYDPNDKTGFPTGLGTQYEILPNQQLQYLIRFQNTGTDTAFNIVVRDTLDTDLNIFSVVPGAASHNYTFRMYGPRVLEWTFTNIMLPDSNVNEATSHGFLTFRVDQQPNLQNGTVILNDTDIYFDFNAPVITNETVHTINNQLHNFVVGIKTEIRNAIYPIKVYPNPASNNVTILLTKESLGSTYSITNQLGQVVMQGKLTTEQNLIEINDLQSGFYVVTVEGKNTKQSVKLVKQ